MRKPVTLLASISLAVLLACVLTVLTAIPGAGQTTTVTLVGAGDIASCSYSRDQATANVVANVAGTVYTLGDNVYPDGTAAQFSNCYHPTWGAHKSRTKPSVGNHEYHTQDASGYFNYFGGAAGSPNKG
jgi:acid phosphatase type 7